MTAELVRVWRMKCLLDATTVKTQASAGKKQA